jgi:hypothetical protein
MGEFTKSNYTQCMSMCFNDREGSLENNSEAYSLVSEVLTIPLAEAGNLGRELEWGSEKKVSLVLKNLDKLCFREWQN